MYITTSKETLLELAREHPEAAKFVDDALANLDKGQVVTSLIKHIEHQGHNELARQLAKLALQHNPRDSFFTVQYGILSIKAGMVAEADRVINEYKSKFGYPPKNPRFKLLEASIHRQRKEFDEAIQILVSLPRNRFVINELAENYYLKRDFIKVKDLLLHDHESNPEGALLLARVYVYEGLPDQAHQVLKPHLNHKHAEIDEYAREISKNTNPSSTQHGVDKVFQNELEKFRRDHPSNKTIFIMMKFSGGILEKDLRLSNLFDQIKLALDKYGFDAVRADEKDYSDTHYLWDNVQIYAMGCDYGIAILEDLYENEMNPNVAMEYGYMLAKGKKVLLFKERSFKNIRADLIGKLWKEFDIDDSNSIRKAVENWIGVDRGYPRLKV